MFILILLLGNFQSICFALFQNESKAWDHDMSKVKSPSAVLILQNKCFLVSSLHLSAWEACLEARVGLCAQTRLEWDPTCPSTLHFPRNTSFTAWESMGKLVWGSFCNSKNVRDIHTKPFPSRKWGTVLKSPSLCFLMSNYIRFHLTSQC